ncbi:Nlp2 [Thalictrum thalictroides]|uniref:Nlp2 n=1 Tax=Thalictrum thalictroides TaxID=46969 RepID=A0A7J6WMW1_THATH|nr:Nlp2 [Thalictrum thalictroides]
MSSDFKWSFLSDLAGLEHCAKLKMYELGGWLIFKFMELGISKFQPHLVIILIVVINLLNRPIEITLKIFVDDVSPTRTDCICEDRRKQSILEVPLFVFHLFHSLVFWILKDYPFAKDAGWKLLVDRISCNRIRLLLLPSTSPLHFGSEIDYRFSNLNQVEENAQEKETSFVPEDQSSIEIHTENSIEPHFMHPKVSVIAKSSHQSEYYLPEEFSESSRRCWIGPGSFSSVRERLFQALQCIKNSIGKEDVLIQIWLPVKSRHKQVLTTNDQPYALDPKCQRLASYRSASMQYEFAVEGNSNESVGLPGRVFLQKVPE